MRYETLIHNGVVVTVDNDFRIIDNGFICIQDGLIKRVGSEKETLPEADEIIDAKKGFIIPGLVNTHTHLPMSIFRGLADDLPLMTWLNEHIFPSEAKFITPDSVKYGASLSCSEMLLSGTTTCCDGYFLEENIAESVLESGMRAVLGQGVIDYPAPGVPDPTQNVKYAYDYAKKLNDKNPLLTPSIFCHSPYTCSAETLQKAKKAAAELGIIFQIHLSETKFEFEQINSEHGLTPVAYLDRLGILDENSLLVHSVWMGQDDLELVAKRGAKISHNPESNMKLASGTAPVQDYIEAGIVTGIGTDGCASNNDLDLFCEMDSASKLQKVTRMDSTVLNAETVLKMATIYGARAIGLGDKTGSLEVGKEADIVIIDIDAPHLVPVYSPVSHLVYSVKGSDVRDVFVSGKHIVKERNLLSIDLEGLYKNIQTIQKSIIGNSN